MNFDQNINGTKKIEPALYQYSRLTGKEAKEVFTDSGYPRVSIVGKITIHMPRQYKNIKLTKRQKHKRRAAIEPVIGHLKHDYRMLKKNNRSSWRCNQCNDGSSYEF